MQEDISAINDIERLLTRLDKPKRTPQQIYWQETADRLALKFNMPMAVVEIDAGHYQIWSANKAGKDYIYCTGEVEG